MNTRCCTIASTLTGFAVLLSVGCTRQSTEAPLQVQKSSSLEGVTTEEAVIESLDPEREQELVRLVVEQENGELTRNNEGRIIGVDVARDRTPVVADVALQILEIPALQSLRLATNTFAPELHTEIMEQTTLEELLLRDVPLADGQLVELVNSLPNLRRLTLRNTRGFGESELEAVAKMPHLEVLALLQVPLSKNGVAAVSTMTKLRSLDLRLVEGVGVDGYNSLTVIPNLKELKIGGPSITDEVFGILPTFPKLTSLTIEDSPALMEAYDKLIGNPELAERLESFTCTRCYFLMDDSLKKFANYPKLTTLRLHRLPVTGEFLEAFQDAPASECPELQFLQMTYVIPPQEVLAMLPLFSKSLRRLDLTACDLSSPGMSEPIGELLNLEVLTLASCSLSDEAVQTFSNLKKLKKVNLSGNFGLTDRTVESLGKLPALESVNLKDTSAPQP